MRLRHKGLPPGDGRRRGGQPGLFQPYLAHGRKPRAIITRRRRICTNAFGPGKEDMDRRIGA
jgi:hypothetical protein